MTISSTTRKDAEAFRTISEVAETINLPQHVLRFWETKFAQIKPLKRAGGRRFYRPEDVELLIAIRQLLYGEGYTIKGVQRILKEQGPRAVAALAQGRGLERPAYADEPDGLSDPSGAEPMPVEPEDGGGAREPTFGPAGAQFRSMEEPRLTETPALSARWSGAEPSAGAPRHPGPGLPLPVVAGSDLVGSDLAREAVYRLEAVLSDLAECRRILQVVRG